MKIKALTLHQPWASLIALGEKKIETQTWETDYRGPLGIHAAINPKPVYYFLAREPFRSLLIRHGLIDPDYPLIGPGDKVPRGRNLIARVPLGKMLATCELVDCRMIAAPSFQSGPDHLFFAPVTQTMLEDAGPLQAPEARRYILPPGEPELSLGNYAVGRYAWILENVKPLPAPIPVKGMQGLWNWEYNPLDLEKGA